MATCLPVWVWTLPKDGPGALWHGESQGHTAPPWLGPRSFLPCNLGRMESRRKDIYMLRAH